MMDDGEIPLPSMHADPDASDRDEEEEGLQMHDPATGRALSPLEIDAALAASTGDAVSAARYRALAVHYGQAPESILAAPLAAVAFGPPPCEGP